MDAFGKNRGNWIALGLVALFGLARGWMWHLDVRYRDQQALMERMFAANEMTGAGEGYWALERLTRELPRPLSRIFTSVNGVQLSSCVGSPPAIADVRGFPDVEQVDLYCYEVVGDELKYLQQLPKLKRLTISQTSLGDDPIRYLKQIPQLEEIKLIGNLELPPGGIEELQKALPSLTIRRVH